MKPTISISISFLGWLICWHISFAFRGADNYVPGNFICLLHKSKNFHHLTRCYKHSHTLPYCLKCSNKSRANDIIPRPAKLLLFVTFLFEVLLFFFLMLVKFFALIAAEFSYKRTMATVQNDLFIFIAKHELAANTKTRMSMKRHERTTLKTSGNHSQDLR